MIQDPESAHVVALVGRPPGWPDHTPEAELRHLRRAAAVLCRRVQVHRAAGRCAGDCEHVRAELASLERVCWSLRGLGEGDDSHSDEGETE